MAVFALALLTLLVASHFLLKLGIRYCGREQIPATPPETPASWPFVSVVVPARNEEATIGACVSSLARQSYPADRYEVIVVDDHSEDATARIVNELAAQHPQLSTLPAPPLPDGWTGKNNACAAGAAKARGTWLCCIDADTEAEPALLEAAVAFALAREADLLSFTPLQQAVSVSERLFLPGIFTAIAVSLDFRAVNDPASPAAIANGQFLLFRRSVYEEVGGHAAVAGEIMEDMAFARRIKSQGLRLYWAFADHLMRTRMYRSMSAIWQGFAKNMSDIADQSGSRVAAVASAARSMFLAWAPVVAVALAIASYHQSAAPLHAWALGLSLGACLSLATAYGVVLHALRVPLWYVPTWGLGFSLHGILILYNLWNKRRRNLTWKGRRVA